MHSLIVSNSYVVSDQKRLISVTLNLPDVIAKGRSAEKIDDKYLLHGSMPEQREIQWCGI